MKKISMVLVVTLLCTMFQLTGSLAYADVPYSGTILASGLNSTMGIIIGPDDKVYVSDYSGGKIVKMDKDGSNLTTVTTNVLHPVGIAFDNSGNLIVAEHNSSKITKVDSGGNTTLIKGGLGYVTGVVVDSHDKIFAVDYSYGKIYKMDADGSNSAVFATILNGSSTVTSSLIGLGIDANDNLYLSDQRNSRILKIDPSGVQSDFASVNSPYWVSVGKDGYVYASSSNRTIQKFDLSGNKIETYSTGTHTPWGTQVDTGGGIYFVYNGATVNRILGYADTVDRTHVKITLVYDMVSGAADASAFTLSGVGSNPQVTSAVINGSEIDLTVDSNIESTDTNVKVNYTKTGTNNIVQQGTSIEINNFSNLSVTNHIVGVASVGTLSTINVDNGTVLSAVGLPTTVALILSNSTTTSSAVVWDGGTPVYDGDAAGTYTFRGALSLGNDIYNPENKKATVDVVVAGVPIPTVTTMSAISVITVSNGTELSAVGLPTTVSFSLSDSTTTSAAVVWDGGTPTYDGDILGIYAFTGTIASSSDYVNPSNLKASVNVAVGSKPTVTTMSAISVIKVSNGTDLSEVGLPTTVSFSLSNSTTTSAAVVWDRGTPTYDGDTAGTYAFTGTIASSSDYVNPSNLKASVNVVVRSKPTVTTMSTISVIKVSNGTDLSEVGLPTTVSFSLSNSTTTSAAVVWDRGTPTYDGDTAGTYAFTGAIASSSDYVNPSNLKASVNVVVRSKPTVTTMSTISVIKVSNGTELSAVGLPMTVSFSLSDSTTTSAAVMWDGGTPTYNGDTAGTYAFTGTIASSSDYVNPSNLKASVNVVVQAVPSSNDKNHDKSNLGNLNNSAIVEVNGVEKKVANEVRTIENGKSKVDVSIDNVAMKKIIDDLLERVSSSQTPVKNLVEINVQDTTADTTVIGLNGAIVKQMDQNEFDVLINVGDKTYKIPAEELAVDAVANKLGVDKENLKSIQFYIQLDTVTSEEQTEITKKVESNNGKIIVKPTEFKISAVATRNDGTTETVEIDTFKQYVIRRFEIPNDVNATDVTTGVVFDRDYNYSQVPTHIHTENGKTYAEINSLTNSIYSVISNPVTVNSVKGHWSESIVNDMASRLILTDYDQFKADKNVTRGEFATYMIRALGLYKSDASFETSFTDVKKTDKNAVGIALASQWSLVRGYEDGTFKPNNEITREEAMVLLAKAMKIANYEGVTGASSFEIKDNEGIPNWSKPYIQKVLDGKVFVGRSDNDLALKQNLTHAETLAALRNLLIKAELINEK